MLEQALASPPSKGAASRCGVGVWIRSLSPSEQTAALALLGQVSAGERFLSEVSRLFSGAGLTLRQNAVYVHHRGHCSCLR